ncbi:MAG: DMT family transporter [Oceanospirillaceae bacterium]|nr:DMT family transporter [Oceanospirillaceae bacterium]
MTQFLYLSTVLIWGTTWIAIPFQLGEVAILTSVFYRFALAAAIMLSLVLVSGRLQTTSKQDHSFMVLHGMCLFSLNFVCVYTAGLTVSSGLLAVIFSSSTLFNAINNRIFWGEKPTPAVFAAGILGIIGLSLMFWPELAEDSNKGVDLGSIGFAFLGTFLFSLGNMISVRHNKKGLKPFTSSAYAMVYGTLFLAGLLLITNTPLTWDSRPQYLGGLFYLAIIGSVAGFTAYLSLVARIGASKAAYATVLFPVVALALSTVFEGYAWSLSSLSGLVLVLLGNGLILGIKLPFMRRPKASV